MNILFINHTSQLSGADYSLGSLIDNLSKDTTRVMLIRSKSQSKSHFVGKCKLETTTFMPIFMTTPRTPPYGFLLLSYHIAKLPLALWELRKLVKKHQITHIHLNESDLMAYAFFACLLRLPVIIHARGAIAAERKGVFRAARILSRCRNVHLVGIDKESINSYPKEWAVKSSIVYNPVKLQNACNKTIAIFRDRYNLHSSDLIITQVAALHVEKGVWELLDVFQDVLKNHKRVKLLFVGDDHETHGEGSRLKEAVSKRGLTDSVVFTGYLHEVAVVYAITDIVLCMFGKYLRGVGRTAYEAAIYGKPLVATIPSAGGTETVIDGKTGLIYDPNDHVGIVQGINKLLQDTEYRLQLGKLAKATIGLRHDPQAIATQIERIFRSMK